jgi:hypothetical protein
MLVSLTNSEALDGVRVNPDVTLILSLLSIDRAKS